MEHKKAPTNLTHKPIYAINNYDRIDGFYKNNTDVHAISIGKAQWNSEEVIPSVKVWRKKNERWSRQSEETTLTRAIDMAMFVVQVLNKHYNGKDFSAISSVYGSLEIDNMNAEQSVQNEFNDFLDRNKMDIENHLELLHNALNLYYEK